MGPPIMKTLIFGAHIFSDDSGVKESDYMYTLYMSMYLVPYTLYLHLHSNMSHPYHCLQVVTVQNMQLRVQLLQPFWTGSLIISE